MGNEFKMNKFPVAKKVISVFLLFFQTVGFFFATEPTVYIEPYTKDNIPTWAKDLRRTEIITFGSLPFVTMGVTMGYSFYRYFSNGMDSAYFPNPLAKTSEGANLSHDEQVGIIVSSAAISLLLGLTDLTINLIQRHKAEKQAALLDRGTVTIEPYAPEESIVEDFDSTILQEEAEE